jgi:ribosome-binding protein aMBF1 (putative translation factor)
MAKLVQSTTDAIQILKRRHYTSKPERVAGLEAARQSDAIGRRILELRTAAGLTQAHLAKPIGTTASVICRLEDANDEGHSLVMLRRVG